VDGKALVMVVFESEDATRVMLPTVPPGADRSVNSTIDNSEVRDGAGHA
jgi:hypothetical protein